MSGKIIFDNGKHQCIMFSDLVKGDGIQSNQFLILHSDEETVGAVIDPGGDLTYTPLTLALLKHTDIKHIRYVIGSHQDPDIIASLPRWLLHTQANIVISRLWERFLPHLNSAFTTDRLQEGYLKRLIALPDEGAVLPLGKPSYLLCLRIFCIQKVIFSFMTPSAKFCFQAIWGLRCWVMRMCQWKILIPIFRLCEGFISATWSVIKSPVFGQMRFGS